MTAGKPRVLGIDLGTSSLKCVVMDGDGRLLAAAERAYPTQRPEPGWAEQNPEDWLAALREAIAELRASGSIAGVAAIGLCSAAHIPVLLDDADKVMRPAILWSDQRSDREVAFLHEHYQASLEAITLNDAGCTWTLPQLLWIANHEPALLGRVRRFLSSKDYLIYRLTGKHAMDHASGAATLMLDARKKEWSSALTALSALPAEALPRLVAPLDVVGTISAAAALDFGLPGGTKVVCGTLDSAAEMVGCGILAPGERGMIRVGSAGGIMAVTDRPAYHRGIITYPHPLEGLFYKQAGTNSCATSLKWIRKLGQAMLGEAGPDLSYERLDGLAAAAAPGAGGVIFHPYIEGERAPYWNSELRGSFTGIDQRHGWPEFVRAVMEGVAFSLLDCLEMFRQGGLDMRSAVMTGGVAKSPVWAQIITDVLGIETLTIRQGDSALGACLIAATGIGVFGSIEEAVAVCVHRDKTLLPDARKHACYQQVYARYRKIAGFLNELTPIS